ncbi:MAG: hypothetical protein ACI9XO_000523 [Paraglaciecola sp.]|jgi:hypothetical protein
MKLLLQSCNAARPDKRAITKMLEEIAIEMDNGLARELTDILLGGSEIEIDINDKSHNSAMRSVRKLKIDYEIVD